MITRTFVSVLIAIGGFGMAPSALAHGGGLNAEGCHNDRKNGGYHCHRSPQRRPRPVSTSAQPTPQGTYANCTAARAAGGAPVRRGEPGYGPHLDRDNDGIGCE